jgi:tetratricopeptide (TPR) repeat protein
MMRVCAAALLAIGLAPPARAQNVEGYLALARRYAAGQGDDATQDLARWSRLEVASASAIAVMTGTTPDLLATTMLHTDLANSIIDTEPDFARFHLNMAARTLTVASGRIGQRNRLAPFVSRWYRLVASVYTSCELLNEATAHIQRGLDIFPDDAPLFVARGVVLEVTVRKRLLADWRRDTVFGATNREAIESALKRATDQFMRALSLDLHNAEAHLHLGWVRLFLGDGRARAELDAAIADARDDRVRYLAHLFLGGLAEHEKHLEEARQHYESARTLGPEFQTPYVALSRVEQAIGDDGRARELALIGLGLDKRDGDDPWWDHRIGFDRESLLWLRDEVRRPQ